MKVDFRRLTWENYPSTETPINADNLNRLEEGVAGLYSDVAEIEEDLSGGVGEYVTDWLTEHVTPSGSAVVVDDTLSITGAAADAKKAGDEIAGLKEAIEGGTGRITTQQWNYMISLFRGALYDTTILPNPKTVIDALEDSIDKIPATGITLSTSSLTFSNGTSQVVGVTLTPSNSTDSITATSGSTSVATVSVNNRTITVTPVANGSTTITISTDSGLTATVSVSVALPQLFTVTNDLTGCTSSNDATSIYEGESYSATLTLATDYTFSSVSITMGNTDITSTAWDSSTGEISIASVTGNIVITAVASTPVLYALPAPYVSSGEADNYINTRLMLGEVDQSFSVAGYIKFDYAFPDMGGTNKQILYLGNPTDNTQFGFVVYNSMYALSGIGRKTPTNYNHRQNVKFVITHEAGSLDLYSIIKYFDQEDSSVENRVGDTTKTFSSFVPCGNPLYIGKRTDGYGVCNNLTLQTLKIFNYVMDSTAITNFISTEEATV